MCRHLLSSCLSLQAWLSRTEAQLDLQVKVAQSMKQKVMKVKLFAVEICNSALGALAACRRQVMHQGAALIQMPGNPVS